jgi:photosystem II stability/assembly factor-like uncharacterized protein
MSMPRTTNDPRAAVVAPASTSAIALALALLTSALASPAAAQWLDQPTGSDAEFRGLAAVDSLVAWAGGRNGAFARTVDGGTTWVTGVVAGAESLFFVDVHALDADTAWLLGTSFEGGLARIYHTTDGGTTWRVQFEDTTPGAFYDGFAFWDARRAIAFSDPVGGSFRIVRTEDGGRTWRVVAPENIPPPLEGEAGFAASGTAVVTQPNGLAWIGTGGGRVARVYRTSDYGATWEVAETPLAGGPTAGIFGIAFRDSLNGVAVGGDYQQRTAATPNILRTRDGGRTWELVGTSAPAGVRYGVVYVPGTRPPVLVAVGPSGSGYSLDDGATWTPISEVGYNTVSFAAPNTGWAAGTQGRIARWRGRFGGER